MEITNTKLDFIALPTTKSENVLDLHKRHFTSIVENEYNFYKAEDRLSYETYLLAQKNKLEYNSPILNGEYVLEIPNKLPELKYYRMMLGAIMNGMRHADIRYLRINGLTFKDYDMFMDYMNTIFTDEALMTNALLEGVNLDLSMYIQEDGYFLRQHPDRDNLKTNPIKKYQKGMKLTRFLTSFFEALNKKDRDMEKTIGRFRIDPNDKVKIYISSYLPSIIKGGAIGHSCLSEGGVNEHATFMILGYQNTLIVHDSDFEFRAWLALDHKQKYFTLAHTYPRENFFLQIMVYEYMKSIGYQPVRHYFQFPEYMDMGLSEHFSDEAIDNSSDSDSEKSKNRDAYYDFSKSLFLYHGETKPNNGRIAYVYGCDGCDKTSIRPDQFEDGYCDSCRENDEDYGHCHRCDERTHNDYLHYDEENEEYYCEGCRDQLEEEREEERQREEEAANAVDGEEGSNEGSQVEANEERNFSDVERLQASVQSIDLQIGTNLVKQHKAEDFYKTLKLMQRVPNLLQTQDILLLSATQQKISNYREYSIFGSLMGAAAINWADNQRLQDFNPTRNGANRYPYYMNINNSSETTYKVMYGQSSGSDTENRPTSEMYLRYFYLAKNKLHLIKTGAAEYQTLMVNIPDDVMNLQQKISFAQKNFSHADIYKVIPFEKNAKFTFKDAAAYDIFMFMLHGAGYMWNTKVPLWGRAMPTLNQGFDSNYFYGINNKGFIETWTAQEGAFPQDTVVLTTEMLLGHINK